MPDDFMDILAQAPDAPIASKKPAPPDAARPAVSQPPANASTVRPQPNRATRPPAIPSPKSASEPAAKTRPDSTALPVAATADSSPSQSAHTAVVSGGPVTRSRFVPFLASGGAAFIAGIAVGYMLFSEAASQIQVPVAQSTAPAIPAPQSPPVAALPDAEPLVPAETASTSPPVFSSPAPGTASPETPVPNVPAQLAGVPTAESSNALAGLVTRVDQSLVTIFVQRTDGIATGSGFLAGDHQTLVTNFHVMDGAISATATFEDGTVVEVMGYSAAMPDFDLCALVVEKQEKRLPLEVRESVPGKGESVAAFGSPLGFGHSVSTGIVSAIRTGKQMNALLQTATDYDVNRQLPNESEWIQFTAGTVHGSSGGPLVDMSGRVSGVVTLGLDDWKAVDLDFAVASRHAAELLASRSSAKPLSELPHRPKSPAEVAIGEPSVVSQPVVAGTASKLPEGTDRTAAYYSALNELHQKRRVLLVERKVLVEKLITLDSEVTAARTELQGLQQNAAGLQNEIVALNNRAQNISNNTFPLTDAAQAEINRISLEVNFRSSRLQSLNLLATPVTSRFAGLQRELQNRQREAASLQQKSDLLRDEWLRLADPFVDWSRSEHEKSMAKMTEWIILDSEHSPAYIARAVAYIGLDNLNEALSDAEKAVEMEPRLGAAHAIHALTLGLMKQSTKSDQAFKKATTYGKGDPFVPLCKGLFEMHDGQWQKAIAMFRNALKMNERDVGTINILARTLAACPEEKYRDGKEAKSLILPAVQQDKGARWVLLDTLAAAHAECGEFDLAIDAQSKAIKLAPDDSRPQCVERMKLYEQKKPLRSPR